MHYKIANYFIATALLLLVIFYAPLIFLNKSYFGFDHSFYFEPLTKFVCDSIKQGRLPLWNPLLHCGMSQIAVPSPGVFYPPNLLFVCMPFGGAFAWFMIFHQLVAGFFAVLLILDLGWGTPAALCAGIAFAFCGYMFSLSSNYTLMATAAWVPLNFWSVRALSRARERDKIYLFVCLSALSFFLLIAAGRPEISVMAASSIVLFVLWQSRFGDQTKEGNVPFSNLPWQCLALFIGFLLSMPIILPAAEWLINSPRAQGLSINAVFTWSANWYDVLSIGFAQPFGDLTLLGAPFLYLGAARPGCTPFLPSPLVGPVVITLAIWGFADKKWAARTWVFLLLSISLLMVLGNNGLIFPKILEHMPFVNLFRYPIKLVIIPIVILALAAARGMYCLTRADVKNISLISVIVLWSASLLVGCCFTTAGLLSKPLPLLNHSAPAQLMLGESLLLGSFLGLATFVLAFLLNKRLINTNWTVTAINALLLISLYVPALCYRPLTISSDFYTTQPFVLRELGKITKDPTELKKQRILALYKEPIRLPATYSQPKHPSRNGNYFSYCRDLLLPNTNLDSYQPLTLGYEAAETGDYKKLSSDLIKRITKDKVQLGSKDYLSLWHFCRATATSWICSQISNDQGKIALLNDPIHFQLVSENPGMNLRIYKVQDPLSRAFVCQNWSWACCHEGALEALSGTEADDFDPEKAALVEKLPNKPEDYPIVLPPDYLEDAASDLKAPNSDKQQLPPNAVITQAGVIYPGTQFPASSLTVQAPVFLKDSPENISISVNLDKANFLVLCDKFYPGWTATVDGLRIPIFRANGCFRGVYVPSGGHLVQFDYEPLSLTVGFYCALLAASILAWLSISILSPYLLLLFRRFAGEYV